MSLGDLEQVILLALVRLRGEGHGTAIALEIEDGTGRKVSPGALYTVLERLSGKGYVTAWIGDSTPERGGRRRKVYRIEAEGARALRSWFGGIQTMAAGISERLEQLAGQPGGTR